MDLTDPFCSQPLELVCFSQLLCILFSQYSVKSRESHRGLYSGEGLITVELRTLSL